MCCGSFLEVGVDFLDENGLGLFGDAGQQGISQMNARLAYLNVYEAQLR